MSFKSLLIEEVDHELAVTRKMLARMPGDGWDYKPHPKSMELGKLASHLVDIINWGVVALEHENECDLPADYKPFEAKSPEGLLKRFDESAKQLKTLVSELDERRIDDAWSLKFAGKEMFTMPRLKVLRHWMLNHLVHHRAQLGVYLRMREVPVPASYGPSADEAVALL